MCAVPNMAVFCSSRTSLFFFFFFLLLLLIVLLKCCYFSTCSVHVKCVGNDLTISHHSHTYDANLHTDSISTSSWYISLCFPISHTKETPSSITLQPFKACQQLYVSPGLTFTNSKWWSHSVYVLSEQTATVALYSINSLVYITKVEGVYSAVRTDSLYNTDTFRL